MIHAPTLWSTYLFHDSRARPCVSYTCLCNGERLVKLLPEHIQTAAIDWEPDCPECLPLWIANKLTHSKR